MLPPPTAHARTHDVATRQVWTETAADTRVPLLPWTAQDAYKCEQQPGEVRMLRMENADLVVDITPQYGGKIWRAYSKVSGATRGVNWLTPARALMWQHAHRPPCKAGTETAVNLGA